MTAGLRPVVADLAVGQEVARRTIGVDRARLVRYAGASGDFNPIHWNDRVATSVGLPGVIAHGMWTMGAAIAVVVDWAGDPGRVVDYRTRFTRPVPVPDPGEAFVEVVATVGAMDAEAGTVRVDLAVAVDGVRVLGKAQAVVRLV
ncbi:MaoC/PaaZ C-terminal domain-containing protein [Cellulomonas wangsupingiae]|uniref:MaoC/PaaZ C-terminal domain-containing protein n=1 Tax=Cellulomonas wangsupingiae TaxID=2968085 RepID=A0ABY5K1M5_9CELL|nr:MaoC/PaaZ C-terminal domain-containing protein [Cellulomonas wangsupingiae]MCC2336712.1 MaoC family dehydratase N-terminal domain-containing protein [Cellulomonas wangsupingiae]UUI64235.1 MaoC/PaaZ C-terminal domain-containing protein [Cellulomonas wangsupingiae]